MIRRLQRAKLLVFSTLLSTLTVALIASSAAAASAASPAVPKVTSASAMLIDAKTGHVIYQKNPNQKRPVASTTKVMTGLLTLEKGDLGAKAVASDAATRAGGSSLYLKKGHTMTREQLLWALMLRSANDGAVVLAESNSGSVAKFSKLMNKRAKELGATGTHFNNPNGMPDPKHYSTAHDLSLITRKAMENPFFRQIVRTQSYTLPPTNGSPVTLLENHNRLLKRYSYTTGVKTGYTDLAGHCLVSSASKGDVDLILVILGGSSADQVYVESEKLLKYGFKRFERKTLVTAGQTMSTLTIPNVDVPLALSAGGSIEATIVDTMKPQVVVAPTGDLKPPITKGERVGSIIVKTGDQELGRLPLIASTEVKAPSLAAKAAAAPGGLVSGIISWIAGLF